MHGVDMLRPGKARPALEPIRKTKPDLKQWARAAGAHMPLTAGFFLLSIAQCLSVPSPYAVCCLMALLAEGLPFQGAVAGLALGLIFRLAWGLPLDLWVFIACGLCFAVIRLPWSRKGHLYLLTLCVLLVRAVPEMTAAQDMQTVLFSAAGVLLGLAVMPALVRCAQLWKNKTREWTEDDLLCLSLPALLMIAGASRLSAFQMNIGYTVSAACVLYLSWSAGSAVGVCAAMGCGLALLLGGQNALLLVLLAFGALMSGLFQGKNRLLAAGLYLLSSVTLTYLIAYSFQPAVFYAGLTGGMLFALLPSKWAREGAKQVRGILWNRPRDNAYIRLKMQRWVRSIDRLADALPHSRIEKPAPQEESEGLSEALCAGCDRLPICWHEQGEQTRAGLRALAEESGNPEEAIATINRYFSACPRISRIPPLLTRLDEERQRRAHQAVCAEYEREMLQTHLTALSQAAQRISLEGMQADREESYWLTQADEALEALRFPGKTAFVKKVDGRLAVCLQCEPLSLRPLAGLTLAKQVGTYLGADLEITERQSSRIMLEERPPLMVHTGMATACAVTLDRKSGAGQPPDNGDAVLVEPLSGGKMVLALSDGMGHGAGAQEESRKTLEMLSLCLEAGYTRAQAMTAVNGVMISAAGGEKFATVDLCLIDLWTGETAMNKLGACASILVQGQKAQWIQGEALPLGIIEHVAPMEHRFTLAENDLLLLMSDGVADAFPAQEDILDLVRRKRGDTPQHIADALLHEAVILRDGLPPDDMTVLCARVTDRKEEAA